MKLADKTLLDTPYGTPCGLSSCTVVDGRRCSAVFIHLPKLPLYHMMQVRCPVNINTGEFTKQLRTAAVEGLDDAAGATSAETSSSWGSKLSLFAANHFTVISRGAPALLNTVDFFHG